MTLQQLEYIVALDNCRSFSVAAEICHVTQPSLSLMVQKLEAELGIKLFDRSKQPITPTEIGERIIAQARQILHESQKLHQLAQDQFAKLNGELRISIIPTLSPYLIPLFIRAFTESHPEVQLHISEQPTAVIMQQLKKDVIDIGIMATPLNDEKLVEIPLFMEEFFVYAPHETSILQKQYLLAGDIEPNRLLLLEEGHCIRTQVINLCALQKVQSAVSNFTYETGSLETLRRIVEKNGGMTILPELALLDLNEERMQFVRFFKEPAPAREISLVVHRTNSRPRMQAALKKIIVDNLPTQLLGKRMTQRVSLDSLQGG